MNRVLDDHNAEEVLAAWGANAPTPADAGWKSYSCKLVTPLYGGGVRAGEVDREIPIRGASIRGQLRFWWRVACGPFASSSAMFARETAIWGRIGGNGPTASRVSVRLFCEPLTDDQLVPSNSETDPGIKYAFGPAAIGGVAQWLRPGYRFKLELRYPPDATAEVAAALRWWASFGGLGARTRRGFGAIRIAGVKPVSSGDVASAGASIAYSGSGSGNAESEWKRAVGRLFAFRQKAGTGRRTGHPRPGRSFWPEADQLRRFTGRDANGNHLPEHEAGNVFPRAAFGLPILFEFKGSPNEPTTTELLPADGEDRMASPLILRPHWTGRRWHAMALLLPWWREALAQPLRFRNDGHDPGNWSSDAETRHAVAATIPPMQRGRQLRADDPLSAFMGFFSED